MTMFNYESEELYQMTKGETKPSTPVYMADCKKEILAEVTPNYPKLTEYEKEWLSFAKNIYKDGTPVPLEYLEVQTDDKATVTDVIPFAYKSASLKGVTDENLVSVQMPVLKTVGKNLLSHTTTNQTVNMNQNPTDIRYEDGGFNFKVSNNNWYSVWYDLNLKPKTNYTISYHSNFMDCSVFKSAVNTYVASELVAQVGIRNKNESLVQFTTLTFTSPNEGFVRIRLTNSQKSGYTVVTNLQVEEDTQATSYEPYQSNILTVNEELELRGVGNVKDELNLLTGELTQRINEVVLDGSEGWSIASQNYSDGYIYQTPLPLKPRAKNNMVCDKLQVKSIWGENTGEGITINTSLSHLQVKHSTITKVGDLKVWLASNPITVQYDIENPIIKAVDLNRMIKPYEGTNHYTVSSDTIPPQLILVVPIESTGNQTLNDIITEE